MARKKTTNEKTPPQPASVFESLMFIAVAATMVAIGFLVLAISRYGWQLP